MKHFFSASGDYGDATGMLVVKTHNFTKSDWRKIEECGDFDRLGIAKAIAKKRSQPKPVAKPMVMCCSGGSTLTGNP